MDFLYRAWAVHRTGQLCIQLWKGNFHFVQSCGNFLFFHVYDSKVHFILWKGHVFSLGCNQITCFWPTLWVPKSTIGAALGSDTSRNYMSSSTTLKGHFSDHLPSYVFAPNFWIYITLFSFGCFPAISEGNIKLFLTKCIFKRLLALCLRTPCIYAWHRTSCAEVNSLLCGFFTDILVSLLMYRKDETLVLV
jgi:hypothetical protein